MTIIDAKAIGDTLVPGQWWLGQDAVVSLTCPTCGGAGSLEHYKITEAGEVHPSVQCECGFHQHVELAGWQNRSVQ